MGKMETVGSEGRTVVFVSHSMPAILRLCPRVILLDHGTVIADGPAHDVVRTYLDSGFGTTGQRAWTDLASAPGGNVLHETPLFMRVLENPVVRNNAASGGLKSIKNFGFSTVFLGFWGFCAESSRFCQLFCHFRARKPQKSALLRF
jgi:hypothetical protein